MSKTYVHDIFSIGKDLLYNVKSQIICHGHGNNLYEILHFEENDFNRKKLG